MLTGIDTDENGTIIDHNESEVNRPDNTPSQIRFESLSREASPKPKASSAGEIDEGARKRTRSQTFGQTGCPLQKRSR
jgi:hypothetical protein